MVVIIYSAQGDIFSVGLMRRCLDFGSDHYRYGSLAVDLVVENRPCFHKTVEYLALFLQMQNS